MLNSIEALRAALRAPQIKQPQVINPGEGDFVNKNSQLPPSLPTMGAEGAVTSATPETASMGSTPGQVDDRVSGTDTQVPPQGGGFNAGRLFDALAAVGVGLQGMGGPIGHNAVLQTAVLKRLEDSRNARGFQEGMGAINQAVTAGKGDANAIMNNLTSLQTNPKLSGAVAKVLEQQMAHWGPIAQKQMERQGITSTTNAFLNQNPYIQPQMDEQGNITGEPQTPTQLDALKYFASKGIPLPPDIASRLPEKTPQQRLKERAEEEKQSQDIRISGIPKEQQTKLPGDLTADYLKRVQDYKLALENDITRLTDPNLQGAEKEKLLNEIRTKAQGLLETAPLTGAAKGIAAVTAEPGETAAAKNAAQGLGEAEGVRAQAAAKGQAAAIDIKAPAMARAGGMETAARKLAELKTEFTGPVPVHLLGIMVNPQTGQLALNDRGTYGKTLAELADKGYIDSNQLGGVAKWGSEMARVNAAYNHLNNYNDVLARLHAKGLLPDWDPSKGPMPNALQARMQALWKQALDKSDPDLAELAALDKTSLNILSPLAPTGSRMGYQMMRFAEGALPNAASPLTYQSAIGELNGWRKAIVSAGTAALQAPGQQPVNLGNIGEKVGPVPLPIAPQRTRGGLVVPEGFK